VHFHTPWGEIGYPRDNKNPAEAGFCGAPGVVYALLLSFFPPEELQVGSPTIYVALLLEGL